MIPRQRPIGISSDISSEKHLQTLVKINRKALATYVSNKLLENSQ
jgi:hypothetical protein